MKEPAANPTTYAIPTTPYNQTPVIVWDQLCSVVSIVKSPFDGLSYLYSWITSKNKEEPPCAPGHGLLGSIPELRQRKWNLIQFLHDYNEAYGEKGICKVNLATKTFYIVTDPKMVNKILMKNKSFIRGGSLKVWRKFSPGGLSEGEATQRYRLQAMNAVDPEKLPHYFPGIVQVSNAWLERLDMLGEGFDLMHYCERATLAAMGSSLFKRNSDDPLEPNPFGLSTDDDVKCDTFLHAFHRLFELVTVRLTSGVATIPRFGDRLYAYFHEEEEKEFTTIKDTLKGILKPIFENLLKDPDTIDTESHFYKIITNFGIDIHNPDYADILNKCLGFLQASFETSSKALGWTLYHLARDLKLQELLREEILSKLKGEDPESIDILKDIPLLEQVIEEALRLFPPFPFLLRDIEKPEDFENFKVTKDGTFIISPLLIQRMEKIWGDNAKNFDPSRFNDKKSRNDTAQVKDTKYLTFLRGIHRCPGRHFAKQELLVFIAKFLEKYRIVLEDPDQPPVGLKLNITLQPDTPIRVRVV